MKNAYERFVRPLLFSIDPEAAHHLTIACLRAASHLHPILNALRRFSPDPKPKRLFGLDFQNPIGLAAGLDKNGVALPAWAALGFGFVEIGTVTAKAQPGNPKPRIFRFPEEQALINRLGFNNDGAPVVLARLAARAREGGIVGVNVGANRNSTDRAEDYVRLIETFAPVASYFTVNVSSPNTPGLRDLQQAGALNDLLARVVAAREAARPRSGPTPVLLKIAPDLTLNELDDVVGVARKHRVDGMIVANTTISRPAALREREQAKEQGGLSGRPLFKLSTRMLAETFVRAEGAFPLIGAGGIDSGPTAIAKIKAGATLLQLYTGLVFRGIGLLSEIKADLSAALKRGHRDSLAAMVGADAAETTAESWPS